MPTADEPYMSHPGQESLFTKLPAQEQFTSDDYYTPKWIFDALQLEFDLDVCSPPQATNVPAKLRYTIEDDGLSSPWFGTVFMNPPFSSPALWVRRFIDHADGIALVPLSKSKWFNDLWESKADLIVLPSNLKFDTPNGTPAPIFIPVLIAALGTKAKKAFTNEGIGVIRYANR